jgi:hypothetical protein
MNRYRGKIVRKTFAPGSKSEREAFMLKTKHQDYVLRRQGGNAFFDDQLEGLIDKRAEFLGQIHGGYTLIFSDLVALPEEP